VSGYNSLGAISVPSDVPLISLKELSFWSGDHVLSLSKAARIGIDNHGDAPESAAQELERVDAVFVPAGVDLVIGDHLLGKEWTGNRTRERDGPFDSSARIFQPSSNQVR